MFAYYFVLADGRRGYVFGQSSGLARARVDEQYGTEIETFYGIETMKVNEGLI